MKFGLVLFVSFLLLMGAGSMYYSEGGTSEGLQNITDKMEWNNSNADIVLVMFDNQTSFSINTTERVNNILYKFVDFLGFTTFETAKIGIELGYNNPEYDYWKIGKGLIIYYIVSSSVPLIIPLIALIYVLVYYGKKLFKYLKNKHKSKDKEGGSKKTTSLYKETN